MDPIEFTRIEGAGQLGYRFTKWAWLELSAVTIPANAQAMIALAKSLDADTAAALGPSRSRLVHPPGVTGSRATVAARMKNTSDQITELQSQLKLKAVRMTELAERESDGGITPEEQQEYNGLATESDATAERIARLEATERAHLTLARPVTVTLGEGGGSRTYGNLALAHSQPVIHVKAPPLPPGVEFARLVICQMAARIFGGSAAEIAKARYPDHPRIHMTLKAAVAGATTTDATWLGPLVYPETLASEFIEYLRPMTILGQFGQGNVPSLRRVPFNVRVTGQTSGATAYWVGQTLPKPLTKFDVAATPLGFAKIATISVISEELARFSSPDAESIVRD
jgi:HK97 family phage major capsid protein